MKKKNILLMAAMTTIAISCTNNQDEISSPQESLPIRLSASVNNMNVTRAATNIQSGQFDFVAAVGDPGDQNYVEAVPEFINVEIQDAGSASNARGSYIFKTTNTPGGLVPNVTQPYFPSTGNNINIFAYYPSTVGTVGNSLTTTLPNNFTVTTDQSTAAGYKASDLMYGVPGENPVARTANAIPLTFTHKLAKVIVQLIPDGNGIQAANLVDATVLMKAMASAPISIAGDATAQTWTTADAATINLGTVDATSKSAAAIVVPQTIAASSANVLTITLTDGAIYNYTPAAALTLEAGKEHIFTITLGLHEISVTTTITPWGNGAGDNQTIVL